MRIAILLIDFLFRKKSRVLTCDEEKRNLERSDRKFETHAEKNLPS